MASLGMTNMKWAGVGDSRAVADAFGERLAGYSPIRIAFPGGATPLPILKILRTRPIPWKRVIATVTDERIVPSNHPASNFGRLSDALAGTQAMLQPLMENSPAPHFDLVWLGIGNDGHTASLFPSAEIDYAAAPAIIRVMPRPLPSEAPYERLSLNPAAILQCEELFVVATGSAKRSVLEAAVCRSNDLPITRILAAARCAVTIFWSAK